MKPTKQQFEEYVNIQREGITNMCDIRFICGYSLTGLTRDICMYIMDHYMELCEEYGIEV